jgi:hypothetical protein
MNIGLLDLFGALLGFVFTLIVFSYIWGDNALFRLVNHIFIGVAAGYVVLITINNVILPRLVFPLLSDVRSEQMLALIFLVLSALVLTKISPRLARLGNPAMAFLVGVGAAVAIGGAVIGTVFPQTSASIGVFEQASLKQSLLDPRHPINAFLILAGTLATLIYFQFGIRRDTQQDSQKAAWVEILGWVGQTFIAITFGALFAGVYIAALTAMIERFAFMWNFLKDLILPFFSA